MNFRNVKSVDALLSKVALGPHREDMPKRFEYGYSWKDNDINVQFTDEDSNNFIIRIPFILGKNREKAIKRIISDLIYGSNDLFNTIVDKLETLEVNTNSIYKEYEKKFEEIEKSGYSDEEMDKLFHDLDTEYSLKGIDHLILDKEGLSLNPGAYNQRIKDATINKVSDEGFKNFLDENNVLTLIYSYND